MKAFITIGIFFCGFGIGRSNNSLEKAIFVMLAILLLMIRLIL